MIKTALYFIVASLFGAWLIYQLSTSPELDRTKNELINRTQTINKLIERLKEGE